MSGFKSYESASRFCRCFDELQNHLLARSLRSRDLSTSARRHRFLTRGIIVLQILEAARPPAVPLHTIQLNGAITVRTPRVARRSPNCAPSKRARTLPRRASNGASSCPS
jgi:hypothetical protein